MSMIQIYHLRCGINLSAHKRRSALALLDVSHQHKLKQYRRQEDFETGLFGRLLLLAGLFDIGFDEAILPPFSFNDFGKPEPLHGLHFNISHSGEHVVCAVTTKHFLGIDTEYMNPKLDWDDFEHTFNPIEWQEIKGNHQKFYALWTQKEAVLKAAGTGFSIHPKQVIIEKDIASLSGRKYRLLRTKITPSYETHLAIPFEIPPHLPIPKEWDADIISHLKSSR